MNDDNFSDQSEDDIFAGRTQEEIEQAVEEFTDKVWYDRHQQLKELVEQGKEQVEPQIWKDACKAAKKIEDKYGIDNLGPYDGFEWGMLNGKLSALRWLSGFEWDMLDT